jgi:hypothetical protein
MQDSCSNSGKDFSVCSVFAPSMRGSQKYDPDCGLADTDISLLNPRLEQGLVYLTSDCTLVKGRKASGLPPAALTCFITIPPSE